MKPATKREAVPGENKFTEEELVRLFIGGVMRGSEDDRARAKAAAEEFRKYGPIKRIAFRVNDKVTVYELDPPKKRRGKK